ncbi:MAG TPA: penicillin-binding protein 2 [Actinomycetota bacterium]|nr:penicillin-binding protein 2 [Actinomycetota bacterium]
MRRPPASRLVGLLAAMLIGLVAVVARLAVLQVGGHHALAAEGLEQRVHLTELPSERGRILDRTGVPLAITLEARDVYADPRYVTDPAGEARTIARILDLRRRQVERSLRTDDTTFVYVARQVDVDVADRLAARALPGIGLLDVPKRYYPAGPLASQVLGFVGVDAIGLAGLEYEYEDVLSGTAGTRTVELSADGLPIAAGIEVVEPAVPGRTLVTTIDREIQYLAQEAIRRAVEENDAKGGTIVVMDPRTGEVYAMAGYPWFDPNAFRDAARRTIRNRAVTDMFEPGSVNKVVTAAAALESGAVGVREVFQVPWSMRVGGYTVHDSHQHGVLSMTLGEIVAHSSNIGSAMVAERVGSATLASMLARFGYGRPTGVGFPGEAGGRVPAFEDWTDVTRTTVSYGQGISMTPLQMASVYATVANDGVWVRPRLVRGTIGGDRRLEPAADVEPRRVMDVETATMLTRMLASVVETGTGGAAQIPGYQVAGKTGTARKLVDGRYVQRYMASFVGFLPASRPRVVIAVSIDEPRTIYGGVAAAPAFSEIARHVIQRLAIPAAPTVPLPPLASDR